MSQQQDSSMSETKTSQRFHCLNAEQVEVLHQVLSDVVPIHGRGNFPTLELRPRDIIIAVRARLEKQGIKVKDVRLNGSTASHVLVRDNGTSYKDLDVIFGVELPSQEEFQVIKESVLGCLLDCLPAGVNKERISSATMKEAYVQKMVKVFNEHDRWSLISLSNNSGKNLELKFVSALRRQFEFSVDSFQIILDRLLESYLQQESQRTSGNAEQKNETAETQKKDSFTPLKHETARQTGKSTGSNVSDKELTQISQTEQSGDVCEKESQTELSQIKQSEQTKHFNEEEDIEVSDLTEQKEPSGHTENEMNLSVHSPASETKHSEKAEPPSQTEFRDEPELSDTTKHSNIKHSEKSWTTNGQQIAHSNHKELSEHKEPSCHTQPPAEQRELTEQTGQSELPNVSNQTKAESPNLADKANSKDHSDKTDTAKRSSEDQRSETKPGISTATRTNTHTHSEDERKIENETGEHIQAESESCTEVIEDISASEESQDLDGSCYTSSSALTFQVHNMQPASTQDTPEIHSTLHTDSSEKTENPPDTQDVLPAPPSLVSDKKTSSSPSSKASDRRSHMVVLKHSSPKPPRRMCRKVTPNPYPCPVSHSDPLRASCLDSNTCSSSEPDVDIIPNTITLPSSDLEPTITTPGPEPDPSDSLASNQDLASSPDPAPDVISTSALELTSTIPQEPLSYLLITESLCDTPIQNPQEPPSTQEASEKQSQSLSFETVSPPTLDSLDTLVLHTDESNTTTEHSAHTSDNELSDDDEKREVQAKNMDLDLTISSIQETTISSRSSSLCVTPPISCLNPPVLSLSPPCSTPSPESLSPSPYVTPPSHCLSSPTVSANSPEPSFGSTPLSFSPTSSCLSSPPYLTPPILSLSPPPLCLSPPSPCLSPLLLNPTPPVEAEDLVPQVSSDMEPLIQNTEPEEQLKESSPQPEAPLLQLEVKEDHDYVSLPLAPEPVSFPITIPSSPSHVLPHAQSGGSEDSVLLKVNEESSSVLESKEAKKMNADTPEQSNSPQTTGLVPAVEVLAESMYGDFDAAMDHLRYRLIATRNPEEIRGGGLLKYSNLLVRDYRPASETQIKTLERYMCSRFFIDFPDVQEQQRKILSYLKNHFIGEERSKYQYLMTLRRVVDDSTVCLMGHERRQTLNMITVLALKVLGEQNIIPNTDHVTCFYQPAPYLAENCAPYLAEPSYCSYYIPQGGSTLLYQPYPLHLHTQTGLV